MTQDNLAIVFTPNLLRSPVDDFSVIMNNMGATIKIVRALIGHVRSTAHNTVVTLTDLGACSSMSSLTMSKSMRRMTTTAILSHLYQKRTRRRRN